MSRRRLFLSALFFCNLVEDLRSTNEGFLWSNRSFGDTRGRCRLGWVNESRSHCELCANFACLLACLFLFFSKKKIVMVVLCTSEEEGARTVVEKWAYVNDRLKRSREIAIIPNKKVFKYASISASLDDTIW